MNEVHSLQESILQTKYGSIHYHSQPVTLKSLNAGEGGELEISEEINNRGCSMFINQDPISNNKLEDLLKNSACNTF